MTWCSKCIVGKGCGIYESRPMDECGAFQCQWLKGYRADEERPDKTRIVIDYSLNPVLGALVTQLWEVSHGALGKPFARRVLKEVMASNLPIMLIDTKCQHSLLLPQGFPISQEAYDTFTKDDVPMKYYRALK